MQHILTMNSASSWDKVANYHVRATMNDKARTEWSYTSMAQQHEESIQLPNGVEGVVAGTLLER